MDRSFMSRRGSGQPPLTETLSLEVDSASRPAKRRKTQLACNHCRERKIRCDGELPTCTTCLKRGDPEGCKYEESTLKTQKYVSELEKKVKTLEQTITQLAGKADIRGRHQCDNDTSPLAPDSTPISQADRPQHYQCVGAEESNVDGLATVSPLPSKEDTSISYGGASTIAFLRNLLSLVDGQRHFRKEAVNANQRLVWPSKAQFATPTGQVNPSFLVLPPRRMADSFVDSFFSIVHPLYPILHQPTFMPNYKELWRADTLQKSNIDPPLADSSQFWAMANLVFALGCQFSSLVDSSHRSSLAAEFYERSQRISCVDPVDTSSIDEVQVLLLATVYLQSTHRASRCWNVLGLAIRAAQALGLHLEQAYRACDSQHEREVSRRIWYNCVILDKLQSMTFGRPAMLAASQVNLPEAIDDEYLQVSGEGSQPQDRNSQLAFFRLSITLFDILSDVLSTVYHDRPTFPDATDSSTKPIHEIMQLSARLDQFESNIPLFLRINASFLTEPSLSVHESTAASTFTLQANVLRCRSLYTRLVLLRPLLLAECSKTQSGHHSEDPGNNSFESHVIARACTLCTQTATALIDTLHATINSVLRNSVWYTVYFTFSAAVVLITARIYTVRIGHIPLFEGDTASSEAGFHIAWDKAMSILAFHKGRIRSASRALLVLESLNQKVERGTTAHRSQSTVDGLPEGNALSDLDQGGLGWTEDFNIFDLSNAWLMQEVVNLDNLELNL